MVNVYLYLGVSILLHRRYQVTPTLEEGSTRQPSQAIENGKRTM
jgi:hypothetical protein